MKIKLASFLPLWDGSKILAPALAMPGRITVNNVLFAEVLYNILCSREKLQIRYANIRV